MVEEVHSQQRPRNIQPCRRFSPQFKAEAVQMVLETGRSTAAVARNLGIHDGTLGNWVNAWRREHAEPDQPLMRWSART